MGDDLLHGRLPGDLSAPVRWGAPPSPELRDSNECHRLAFELAPVGLALVGLDGIAFRVNRALCAMLGYTATELTRLHFADFTHPEDLSADIALADQLVRGTIDHYSLAKRYLRKDGSILRASLSLFLARDADQRPLYGIAQVEDASQRLQGEDRDGPRLPVVIGASVSAERRWAELETVLEAIPDPVALRTGDVYVFVNPAFVRVLGYDRPEELHGRRVLDLVHPEDRGRVLERMKRVDEEGSAQDRPEVRFLGNGGEVVPLEVMPSRRVMHRGVASSLLILHDMRERKRLETAFGARDRMATVGTLAAGVGHEINNPLSCVIMNLDLVAEELRAIGGGSPSARIQGLTHMVAEARDGAERVRKVVRGLHTFSRTEQEERAILDLHAVLELSLGLAETELKSRAEVVRDLRPVGRVLADESRLAQVFIGVLTNAAQAFEGRPAVGNIVRVSTFDDAEGRPVVEIADNGPGMAEDVAKRVFEPFFTTKAVGAGAGLGLSIAHNIVGRLGGAITCESVVGVGTTMRIVLPPAPGPESSPVGPASGGARRGRVLVVDHDPSVVATLRRVLGSEHDVAVALGAPEALLLLASGALFDVVLCELSLPFVSGVDLYMQLQRQWPDLAPRVAFFTGGATGPRFRSFLREVPNECLDKPFHAAGVRSLVRRVLGP